MKLFQFTDPTGTPKTTQRVGLIDSGIAADLTSCKPHPTSIFEIYYKYGGQSLGLEETVMKIFSSENPRRFNLMDLLGNLSDKEKPRLLQTVNPPCQSPHLLRIWLAGVTHEESAKLREIEARQTSGETVNVYDQKYRECAKGGIPELFSKTNPDSLVGHGDTVSRPVDTIRLVPETELVTVYGLNTQGEIERLGYTGGNDFTDNGIEALNPLNLPQAKNWSGGCASIGPILVTDSEFEDTNIPISCEVIREGYQIAYKEGNTGQANLNMPDGLYHLEQSLFTRLPLPKNSLQILFWGTPIVFGETDLKNGLKEGDRVRMIFDGIGTLENRIGQFPKKNQLQWLEKRALRGI